jgi:hypothetical protein
MTYPTFEEMQEMRSALHAEMYPEGCGTGAGHHCLECLARLGQVAHKVVGRRIGQRMGVRLGTVEYRCTEPGCKAEL